VRYARFVWSSTVIADRISRFLIEHPGKAFLASTSAIVLTAVDVQQVSSDIRTHTRVITWLSLVLMGTAAVEFLVFPRFVAPRSRVSIAWSVAVLPWLIGVIAAMTGSPPLTMWLGVLLSLLLTGRVALKAKPTTV
jgi:hypothetical protein